MKKTSFLVMISDPGSGHPGRGLRRLGTRDLTINGTVKTGYIAAEFIDACDRRNPTPRHYVSNTVNRHVSAITETRATPLMTC